MRFFAISDLHLPGGTQKPMDVFGAHWEGHFEKIKLDWNARVTESDVVLLPGDFSWAMRLTDAMGDLQALDALPGRKVMIRGNHDYWWTSLAQVRDALPPTISILQNDALAIGGVIICGARGWSMPEKESPDYEVDDHLYHRDLARLRLSLEAGRRRSPDGYLVVMLHYPPLYQWRLRTEYTDLLHEYNAREVVYGHLHGEAFDRGCDGWFDGILYHLVSCDLLGFSLKEMEVPSHLGDMPAPLDIKKSKKDRMR
jgi:predicted phosphohydrolase